MSLKLTEHKSETVAVVDAPAEDAIGHAPVRGGEDLRNQGSAHRSEVEEFGLHNRNI